VEEEEEEGEEDSALEDFALGRAGKAPGVELPLPAAVGVWALEGVVAAPALVARAAVVDVLLELPPQAVRPNATAMLHSDAL